MSTIYLKKDNLEFGTSSKVNKNFLFQYHEFLFKNFPFSSGFPLCGTELKDLLLKGSFYEKLR